MKPQTADNWRCLAAAIFCIAGIGALGRWFPEWPELTLGFLVVVLIIAAGLIFNYRSARHPEQVVFDEMAVTCTLPDGSVETVRWDDLKEVGILTTD